MATKKSAAKKAAPTATAPVTIDHPSVAQPEPPPSLPSVDIAPGISLLPSLQIAANLAPFKKMVEELEAMAGRAVIDSQETYERGIQYMTLNKGKREQLESYRVTVKRPIDDYGKLIQSMFVPLITALDGAQKVVSGKMLTFRQAEQRREQEKADQQRREQEAAAAELAKKLAASGNTDAAEAVREAVAAAPAPVAVPAVALTRVAGVGTQTRKRWVGTVEKPMAVLQAIIDGKLPISLIEFKPVELNAFATDLKVKGTHLGILVDEVESLGIR